MSYKTVIWFTAEIHKMLESGECEGRPIDKQQFLLAGDYDDSEQAVEDLQKIVEELHKKCKVKEPLLT